MQAFLDRAIHKVRPQFKGKFYLEQEVKRGPNSTDALYG